ncbi:ANTAR domain-containing protein [Pseudarthrobacter sp. NPDC058119]|uniref:GAF and ANTAR domain-containing protein n=1 Tax=Pseudarthrobacter sp. NPDC058119 TaxID=3346348 RepID=UPI0036DEA0B0
MPNADVSGAENFADVALHLQDSFLHTPEVGAILQDLAAYAVARLGSPDPGCCCEITVLRPKKPVTTACSNPAVNVMNKLEFKHGDGPGLTAIRTAATVLVPDLRLERRWPEYVQAVLQQGFHSVLSIPTELEGDAQGVLTFYCLQPVDPGASRLDVAETFVRQASKGLKLALRMLKLEETRDGMTAAMRTRTVIDLATGAIMAQNRCSQEAAFKLLRDASSTRNMKLRDVAAAVVASVAGSGETFTYFDE